MTKTIKHCAACLFALSFLYGCKPADHWYGEYLANGELYYPGRVDSLSILPGNQRAVLRLRVTTDPKTSSLRIYVRNSISSNRERLVFPIAPHEHGQIKLLEMNDLAEATYTVNVHTATEAGDSSRTVSASQFIYGESYIRTLVNRTVQRVDRTKPAEHVLVFQGENNLPRPGTFYPIQFTEVRYHNSTGDSTTVRISPYETRASLADITSPSTIVYRTAYKPVAASLDNFYTEEREYAYVK